MSTVLEQYGKLIITLAVASGLLFIVFNIKDSYGNKGIYEILGYSTNISSTDYANRIDTSTSFEKSNREVPTFSVKNQNTLTTNKEICLYDYIYAYDMDGNRLSVNVLKITDKDGNDLTSSLSEDGMIIFNTSGIYTFKLYTVDGEKLSSTQNIKITINRG